MSTSRYPSLEWREVVPGRWERGTDEAETFYTTMAKAYEGSGRMFFAITGFLSLSVEAEGSSNTTTGQRLDKALQKAWIRLRHEHPTIASQVFYDVDQSKWVKGYTLFDSGTASPEHEAWVRETFVKVTSTESGLDWCNADPVAPKVPTVFIIEPPARESEGAFVHRDVVIRSPHDIIDGIGTLHLLNNLLKYAAQEFDQESMWKEPPPGAEASSPSPPLRIAAAIPPILTLRQQERLQGIIANNKSVRQGVNLITLPYKIGPIVPGKHQRIVTELSSAQTAELLQACKKLQATPTHVYHAAIAISMRDLQERTQESRIGRYINYALINERSKCKGEYSTPKHAAAIYHSVSGESLVLDLSIPSTDDPASTQINRNEFLNLVDRVRQHYHAIRDSPDNLALSPCFWSMGTPHLSDPTSPPNQTPIPPPNTTPSVSISSMGIIDKIIAPRHGTIKVESPWVTGEELGTGYGMFLGTWEGRLQVSVAYNDAWHDKEEVEAFLGRCQEIVWKGLGVEHE